MISYASINKVAEGNDNVKKMMLPTNLVRAPRLMVVLRLLPHKNQGGCMRPFFIHTHDFEISMAMVGRTHPCLVGPHVGLSVFYPSEMQAKNKCLDL